LTIKHFGGVAKGRATARLRPGAGEPFTATAQFDLVSIDMEKLGKHMYGAVPLTGEMTGKLFVSAASPDLPALLSNLQADGSFSVARPMLMQVDLGRFTQAGDPAGQGKFNEVTGAFSLSQGRVAIRDLRGVSPSLRAQGQLDISATGVLEGAVSTELSGTNQRLTATGKVGGTIAAPTVRRP
jgi:hypothetical protein